MQRKRGGLVPFGEALGDIDGPVKAIRKASAAARRGFTQADQVNQLVSASETDPDLGFMARMMALCSPAPHQPRRPAPVCPAQRPLRALHDRRWWLQAPLRQPSAPLASLGLDRGGANPIPRVGPGSLAF